MGFTKEDIDAAGSIESLLEGQKRFFGSLTDPLRQTAVINIDGAIFTQSLPPLSPCSKAARSA